jgi:hypothetical protein
LIIYYLDEQEYAHFDLFNSVLFFQSIDIIIIIIIIFFAEIV